MFDGLSNGMNDGMSDGLSNGMFDGMSDRMFNGKLDRMFDRMWDSDTGRYSSHSMDRCTERPIEYSMDRCTERPIECSMGRCDGPCTPRAQGTHTSALSEAQQSPRVPRLPERGSFSFFFSATHITVMWTPTIPRSSRHHVDPGSALLGALGWDLILSTQTHVCYFQPNISTMPTAKSQDDVATI